MKRRCAFGLAVLAMIGFASACDVGTNDDTRALYGDASILTTSTCPCEVGDSNKVYVLACNASACVPVDGSLRGYMCNPSGVEADPNACADAGPCVPQTCAEIGSVCGSSSDGCTGEQLCGTCAAGQFCTEELGNGDDATLQAWDCWPLAANIAIYGNVSGGQFTIDVDVDVPSLAIGIVSGSTVDVTITGQYKDDVVYVYYIGEARAAVTGVARSFVRQTGAVVDDGLFCEDPADDVCADPNAISSALTATTGAAVLFNFCTSAAFSGTYRISDRGSCAN